MSRPVSRMQAAGLGLAAALLLAVAWLADPPAGPVVALAGGVLGWLLARLAPRAAAVTPLATAAVDSRAVDEEERKRQLSALRHDVRGILSPTMLVADRLLSHEDPVVRRAGEVVTRTVERAAARLADKSPGD
jgi:hypothetical protein